MFLEANERLFDRLSNELRLLSPEMYRRYSQVDQYLTGDLRQLGGAWHGMALNRQIGVDNKVHQDWQDDIKGFNAVVPWGNWEGGELTMWPLKLRWQLQPGDAVFFAGSVIAHGVEDVSTGVRNSLDLFTHRSSVKWAEKQGVKAGKVKQYK